MPLPSGRGAELAAHGPVPAEHGRGGAYGAHYPGHDGPRGGSGGTGPGPHPEDAMYMRSGPSAGAQHLPTVAEDDVLSTVGGMEAAAGQEPDLSEYAAAAARGLGQPAAEPTHILVVRNIGRDVADVELQEIFQAFGELQGLHTASKPLGFVVVAYFDLRSSMEAQKVLQGTLINNIAIDVQFAPPLRGNQGQVQVFNLDPDTSNEQLVWLFSKFGEVQGIKQSPTRPNQKFISFYDVRHAAAALRAMNRAEHLNKIPSHVTPQQMATLQHGTSGPNLMQLQGLDGASTSSAGGAVGPTPAGTGSWDNLHAPATVEGLLQLVQNQQHQAMASGMLPGTTHQDPAAAAYGGLGFDPNVARGLPLSDSASSIAGVPHNLLVAANSHTSKSHVPPMHTHGGPRVSLTGMENSQAAAAAMYSQHAASAQQQLQLLQASEAANMLMGLNLGGVDPTHQQAAAAAALWEQQQQAGLHDAAAAAAAAGLWPGSNAAATANLLGPGAGMNLNRLAVLQELQRQQAQQQAAVQQVQALQAASAVTGMNPLAAANLQAAAHILQAAGLRHLGPGPASFLPGAPGHSAGGYNAAAAAQILQQAGLGLPGLGLHMSGLGGGAGLGPHAGGGRGAPDGGAGSRSGGRLSRRTTDPVAEAERKAQQEKLYALDLDKIGRGEDKRTTLMIKNIPNKYTQKMLLATVDEHFKGTYDFFYLPIDFKNKCNVGYAFINMVQPLHIIPLVQRFNHKKWERFNSEKVCHISYARIQGRAALVQHFQNSSLMHEDKRCRPILFTLDGAGEQAGEQEPFPAASTTTSSVGGGLSEHRLGHGSLGSGARLAGLAGSSNSLRSQGGSTNSLRDLQTHKSHHHVPATQLH